MNKNIQERSIQLTYMNKKITLFHKRAIPKLHYTNGKVDK